MFIRTESTPNPNVLKFIFNFNINDGGPMSFSSQDEANGNSFAEALFIVNGISSIYIGLDYISVGKNENIDWLTLKPSILAIMMDFFTSGAKINNISNTNESNIPDSKSIITSDDPSMQIIIDKIIEIINDKVRPAVAMDGGDIVFREFKDGIVYVSMHGACSGCPSSATTLKSGVESMLRHYVPEVNEVVSIN